MSVEQENPFVETTDAKKEDAIPDAIEVTPDKVEDEKRKSLVGLSP